MKSTIRNRATAFGVATVTGPAQTNFSALLAAVHFPTDPTTYADELVQAWGNGNTDRVEAFASPGVVDELDAHRDDNVTHWDRMGTEGAAGTTYVDYVNTVTGETMSLGLPTEAVHNGGERGEPHAVHSVRFQG